MKEKPAVILSHLDLAARVKETEDRVRCYNRNVKRDNRRVWWYHIKRMFNRT